VGQARTFVAAIGVAAALVVGACGDDAEEAGDAAATATASEAAEESEAAATPGADGYTPVSDVAAHAAIGLDAKEIRVLMEPATSGGEVDWAAVGKLFTEGKNSARDDGLRTLAGLAPDDPATAVVTEAITGTGRAAQASPAVRRQMVDKGITVILERKVLGELESAAEKVADKDTDDASGAPHNVDEAWAFYTAEGNGPASTAAKRAADFKKDGQVHEAVITALSAAQAAARAGDEAALQTASADVEAALDYIFYLATFKYLDTENDPVTKAEGETFYLGLQPELAAEAADAHAAITTAFTAGDAASGRAALNGAGSLAVLGITEQEAVASMP
jgi:hypothetical protein